MDLMSRHRPLRAGIAIYPGQVQYNEDFTIDTISPLDSVVDDFHGTLSGLATRDYDRAKVIVSCLHILAGFVTEQGGYRNRNGKEEWFQTGLVEADKVGDTATVEELNIGEGKTNKVDAAFCRIVPGLAANYTIHSHPRPGEHGTDHVVQGTVEPVNREQYLVIGSESGSFIATCTDSDADNQPVADDTDYPAYFSDVAVLNLGTVRLEGGDSGAPVLKAVDGQPGKYQMVGIIFASKDDRALMMRASNVQTALGITFGRGTPQRPQVSIQAVPVVQAGHRLTLDGSRTTDPEGNQLEYAWRFVPGEGQELSQVTLTSTDASIAFAVLAESLARSDAEFEFTATNVYGESAKVTTTIRVGNRPPNAVAKAPKGAAFGSIVTLDGSGSSDPEGAAITYSWKQTEGSKVTLSSKTAPNPTFTAPSVPAALTFELTVTDVLRTTATASVTIEVTDEPLADAGPDQRVETGDTVTLDGSASQDPDGDALRYSWRQIHPSGRRPFPGDEVRLSDTTAAKPTFTAPSVPKTLWFRLWVGDGNGNSDEDTVVVSVVAPKPTTKPPTPTEPTTTQPTAPTQPPPTKNRAPAADAGDPQSVDAGASVTLDGSGSSDPDGDTLAYQWTAPDSVTLTGANTASPTFTAPSTAGSLTFQLTVSDGKLSHSDSVTVTVNLPPPTPDPASTDATLSALSISPGTLSPAFAPGTYGYTASVEYSVSSIDVTATATDSNASISRDGSHELVVGNNVISVMVTAEDGTTTRTYTIAVTREAASTDASLSALSISPGTLSPAFASDAYGYTASVDYLVSAVTVSATAAHSRAGIAGAGPHNLTVGRNTISVVVTAEDGAATKTYTIVVTRESLDGCLSTDATLSALSISPGTLSPAFRSGISSYTASVGVSVSSITVSATTSHPQASITGAGSRNLVLGRNTISVVVTSESRRTTRTYTIAVTRGAITTPPLTGCTTKPPATTQATTQPPTTRATTRPPTTRTTTRPPTTRATTRPPTTRATTQAPTTRATTQAPTTQATTQPPTTQPPTTTAAPTTPPLTGCRTATTAPPTTAPPTTRPATTPPLTGCRRP